MALVTKNFTKFNGYASEAEALQGTWKYDAKGDDQAAVEAAGYFNALAPRLSIMDLIYVVLDDQTASGFYYVSNIANGVVTIQGLAVIGPGGVGLANLAAAVQASHVVKYAGTETTAGGAALEAIAVPGVLATDIAFVQLVDNGTNDVSVLTAEAGVDVVNVTFSADPGDDAEISYQVLRATA